MSLWGFLSIFNKTFEIIRLSLLLSRNVIVFLHFCVVEVVFFHYVFNLCWFLTMYFLCVMLSRFLSFIVLLVNYCDIMEFVSCVDVPNVPTITFVICIELIPFFLPFVYLFQFDFVQFFLLMNQIWKKLCWCSKSC